MSTDDLAARTRPKPSRALTVAVGSGKGGVGKTTLVANLAIALARLGLKVTVVDGDMGLANLDVLLGLVPRRTLEHFFREGLPLEDLAVDGPLGVRVIPAGSGLPELTQLSMDELIQFVRGLQPLRETSDVLIFDTAAGIAESSSRLWLLAERFMLVTWPEPTALVDAYAALKVLRRRGPQQQVGLVVNGAKDADEAKRVHRRLDAAAQQFLGQGIQLDGYVVRDEAVAEAARRQKAVVLAQPLAPASRCVERLALHLAALAGGRLRGAGEQQWENACTPAELSH